MMDKLLFSVVTVTLNCADDAVLTAQSILGQDFANFEYIVKDGGSVDGTVERLKELGVPVHLSGDSGIYDAMNQAINLCRGEYIYFLNAGDTFYSPKTLSRLAGLIKTGKDIYYGNISLLPMNKVRRHPHYLSRYYLFRKNLNHQSWIAKRKVYQELKGFNLNYRYVADQDFLWRALFQYKKTIEHVNLIMANFIYGGTSTKKEAQKDNAQERKYLLNQYYSLLELFCYSIAGLYFLNPLKSWIWYKMYLQK